MVRFTRANNTFCRHAPLGVTLQYIRKRCDDIAWCTMIYQHDCKLDGTTNTSATVYMCSVEAPTLYEDNRESCLWEKGKLKILMVGLINDQIKYSCMPLFD